MGLFSSIGKAVGGLVKTVLPAAGTFFGGPIGGAVGSVLSSGLNFLDDNAKEIIGGGAQYLSANDANQMSAERLAQQNEYNVTNAATANQYNIGFQERQGTYNREAQERQFAENRHLQSTAFAENRSTVDRALDFERDMSNTAYQRASADLSKAGLNRILAVTQGGASTPNAPAPSAATGSASSASVGSPGASAPSSGLLPTVERFGPAMATAMQVARFDQDMKIAQNQERLLGKQAENVSAQTLSELQRPDQIRADANLKSAQRVTEWERPEAIKAQKYYDEAREKLTKQQTKTEEYQTGLKGRELEDTIKYGTSQTGRAIGSTLRMLDTAWKNLRGQ